MSEDINTRVTVIIPTLREAEAIGDVIDELRAHGITNVIVVDGHSDDGTDEIARSKGVEVVYQPGKGKADAVRYGIALANTEYVLVMDGDYTYPAEYVAKLYEKAEEGYDEVIGARVYEPDSQSAHLRFGNKLLTWFFNLLFGTSLSDVLCGMYIVRKRALDTALFEMKGFSVEAEIAAHIASTSARMAEIPIRYRKRKGKKKLKAYHGLLIALDMVRLAWRYNPSFVVFSLGALLLVPGALIGSWVAYKYLVEGVKHYVWGIIAVVLASTGFISLLFAIVSIYLKHLEYRLNRTLREILETLRETK